MVSFSIYGIDFFLRAQMRRYQFSYLSQLIDTGKFLNNSDLINLRDMIYNLKKKFDTDPKLLSLRDEILGLERSITHRLYFSKNYELG